MYNKWIWDYNKIYWRCHPIGIFRIVLIDVSLIILAILSFTQTFAKDNYEIKKLCIVLFIISTYGVIIFFIISFEQITASNNREALRISQTVKMLRQNHNIDCSIIPVLEEVIQCAKDYQGKKKKFLLPFLQLVLAFASLFGSFPMIEDMTKLIFNRLIKNSADVGGNADPMVQLKVWIALTGCVLLVLFVLYCLYRAIGGYIYLIHGNMHDSFLMDLTSYKISIMHEKSHTITME